jgi:hypothetical protein
VEFEILLNNEPDNLHLKMRKRRTGTLRLPLPIGEAADIDVFCSYLNRIQVGTANRESRTTLPSTPIWVTARSGGGAVRIGTRGIYRAILLEQEKHAQGGIESLSFRVPRACFGRGTYIIGT